jgi:hypothetical protein
MGVVVFLVSHSRYCAQRRDMWHYSGTQCVHDIHAFLSSLTVLVWYFFNDVYPPLHNGHSPLDPPSWWVRLFEGPPPQAEEPLDGTEDMGQPAEGVVNQPEPILGQH